MFTIHYCQISHASKMNVDGICKSAEGNLIISIYALICTGNIVELPTISLIALILEDSVVSIEIL